MQAANILCKFETAQNELETTDESDHSLDRELFEQQYFQVKANSLNFCTQLILKVDQLIIKVS